MLFFLKTPLNLFFIEIVLKFNTCRKIVKVGRIKILALLFKIAMIAAYPWTDVIYKAPIVRSEIFTGAPEFDMPLSIMIHEYIHVFMRQVPSDVVVIIFRSGPVYFNGGILAAAAAAISAGRLELFFLFCHDHLLHMLSGSSY